MSPPDHRCVALNQSIGDKYEVLRWIGGGGMAQVFLARHRVHGGLFAVKVLAEDLAGDPKVVRRFLEEARTAASLGGHPNVVQIFDIGDRGGLYWLIMQYIEGEDVSGYLARRGRLTGEEAVCVIRGVAEALEWAARHGVVHRDIKPSNIRIDLSGRVIVLDFGIAKAADSPGNLTTRGDNPGTPYYMSPEQINGEPCTPSSDLYSLGVVFFELLAGRKPFVADTRRDLEAAHLKQLPPALSTWIEVDPAIEQMVNRLLEKRPEDRYASAAELLSDLDAVSRRLPAARLEPQADQEHAGIVGRPPAPADPVVPRQWRLWLIPLFLVAAIVAVWLWPRPGPPPVRPDPAPPPPKATVLPRQIDDGHGPMLLVPAGRFVFGDDAPESPNKRELVELPAFYMDATETSNRQYAAFVKATGRGAPRSRTFRSSPDLPVAGVTFEDAEAYCSWAGRRLPTEQEWEKAARGPEGSVYPWGNQPLPNPGRLAPVEEYPDRQSWMGALNLSGNVFEWTTSHFPVTERELADMKGFVRGAVSRDWRNIKGGSFLVKNELFFRSYMRRGWPVDQVSDAIGFRCVKDAK